MEIAANDDDVPSPVLLNCWKHHAGALRQRIDQAVSIGNLDELAKQLVVIGTELMDLYTGLLTPTQISTTVLQYLELESLLDANAYAAWVESNGGYRVLTFADDSQWVLRRGEEGGRFVHVHPARWAPKTQRVRANVLKTAVMVVAHVKAHGGDPLDKHVVNLVRQQYLGLSPVGRLAEDKGLSTVIAVLK
jgi:hypothetical protein